MKTVTIGITGASGSLYALRLIEILKSAYKVRINIICTDAGAKVIKHETDSEYAKAVLSLADNFYHNNDIEADIASGGINNDMLAVIPCSINTMGLIHSGITGTLIGRVAHVMLKERRNLILVPREMPCSTIVLKIMYELSQAGVSICTASPSYYSLPKSIDEIVLTVVSKVLSLMGFDNNISPRWSGHGIR